MSSPSLERAGKSPLDLVPAAQRTTVILRTPPGKPNIPVKGVNPKSKKELKIVAEAQKFLGTPYSWGGGGPAARPRVRQGREHGRVRLLELPAIPVGKNGVKIPRVTYDQWRTGAKVPKKNLRPGDAVFFHPGGRGPEHVGMYIGNGKFIEAPRTGLTVRISNLSSRSDYMGARRWR